MLFEVVAPVAAAAVTGLGAWGLKLIPEIHDLEGLSARSVGSPGEVASVWAAEDQAS